MKTLVALSFTLLVFMSFGRTDQQRIEQAYFQVEHNGQTAYFMDLFSNKGALTSDDLDLLKQAFFRKEGIFNAELIENGKVVRLYCLQGIDVETIKQLSGEAKKTYDFEYSEPMNYSF